MPALLEIFAPLAPTNQGEVGLVIDNVYHAIRFQ